jgi:hypothetical protein
MRQVVPLRAQLEQQMPVDRVVDPGSGGGLQGERSHVVGHRRPVTPSRCCYQRSVKLFPLRDYPQVSLVEPAVVRDQGVELDRGWLAGRPSRQIHPHSRIAALTTVAM